MGVELEAEGFGTESVLPRVSAVGPQGVIAPPHT